MRRLSSLATAMLALALGGCYSPQHGSPGFYCHVADNPACPDGQQCVNGRCMNPGAHGPNVDLAVRPGSDLATGPLDMSQGSPLDFSTSPTVDLAQGNLCSCASMCPITKMCVGPNCCFEDTLFGTCMPSTTCMPQTYP